MHASVPAAVPASPFGGVPSPFFATAAHRVAWARERFFEQGQRPSGLVSEPVMQSWQRCLASGLRPQDLPVFEPVTRTRVSAVLARNHALLQAAAAEIDQLDSLLAGTGCKTVLTDARGVVLRATPSAAGARELLDISARIGVDLGEAGFGSTAPGVSAWSGSACTVSGGEHFFGVLHEIHCAAAPIRNRYGDIAAVLDLSAQGQPFAFDALALVRVFAASIENRLLAAQTRDHVLLRFQIAPALLGTPMEGLAAVDGRGAVSWVNAAGAALLERAPGLSSRRHVEALFDLTVEQLLRVTARPAATPHRLPSGLGVWIAAGESGQGPVSGPGPGPGPAPAPMPMPTLTHDTAAAAAATHLAEAPASLDAVKRQCIESMLAQCAGNVSEAARRLGVSRGLLYRRLRLRRGEAAGRAGR